MDWFLLLLTALGLSMDAFAVSISNSMCYKNISNKQIVANSASFGLFQGIMPTIGFFAGRLFSGLIQAVDHWIALVLLGFIGGKMLFEGIRALRHPEDDCGAQVFTLRNMLMQSLGTSIDALAVGISFAALAGMQMSIWAAVAAIAAITFVCCLLGGALGKRFGALLGDWAQIFGGLILVGIGLKIFIEHMMGG